MNKNLKLLFLFAAILFVAALLNCENKITGNFDKNIPPETTVFVESTDTLNYTQSVQTLHWDGRDSDGFIIGFYYTFLENPAPGDWQWTTKRSLTFPLKITGKDTIYIFQIKAVDNQNAEDPTPARQHFPILNSPPSISWGPNVSIPDTTFTVANFVWSASDPDGDTTISHFEYALDDTSNWIEIPGNRRSLILAEAEGVTEGDHVFYIRAVDIADASSPIIRMPESANRVWHVKKPKGRYLLIDDYQIEVNEGRPDAYYKSMLTTLLAPSGNQFSYWNIEEQFPSSNTQFSETLKLFDRVIWYTDALTETDPHFIAAQIAIPEFRQNGGKLIYTVQFNTGFGGQGDPLIFSPVDSLGKKYNIIVSNSLYYPDSALNNNLPGLSQFPDLFVSNVIVGMIALVPKFSSVPIYHYDAGTEKPVFVLAGRNDNTGEYDFVFSGTPLHRLRSPNNTNEADLNEFFRIILGELFGF